MKRAFTALALLAGLALSVPSAQATGSPSHPRALAPLTRLHLSALRDSPLAARNPRLHTDAAGQQTAFVNVTSSPQLHLPATDYPAGFPVTVDNPVNAAQADITYQGQTHTLTYESLGMLGGWHTEADKNMADGSDFLLTYLGSYYGSAQAAQTAFTDADAGWSTLTPVSCQVHQLPDCAEITIPSVDFSNEGDSYTGYFRMFQVSNTLFEGGCLIIQSDFNAQKSACIDALNTISNSYYSSLQPSAPVTTPTPIVTPQPPSSEPTPTPTPSPTPVQTQVSTAFTVDAVRFQTRNKDNAPAITTIKAGKKEYLFIYWTVQSLPAGVTPTYSYDAVYKVNGKVNAKGHDSFDGTESSYSPGQHYYAVFTFKFKNPGTYHLKGHVTANDVKKTASTSLVVK
jgi:hypothetical protein